MWNQLFKLFFCLLTVGSIHCYINKDDFSRHSKNQYLNYHLSRFRHRGAPPTDSPRTTFNRNYHSFNFNKKYHHNSVPQTTESQFSNGHKFRHTSHTSHTRFPKMDMLLSKISNLESDDKDRKKISNLESDDFKRGPHKWTTESPFKRYTTSTIKTTTTTESDDNIGEHYDDLDDDNEPQNLKKAETVKEDPASLDWDDESDDDTDEPEDDVDDNDDDEVDSDWQAEEATEQPTERSLTEYKWRHYGTRARVEETRRNQNPPSNTYKQGVREAVEHARRVGLTGGCRVPRARVVRVQAAYPDAGKAYIPHCTLLYRCADDTGCCRSEAHTCAPKHTDRLELYFYTAALGRPGSYNVEKLAFYNHTECHCVDRTQEMMSRDESENSDTIHPFRPGVALKSVTENNSQPAPEPIRRCRCPELYSAQTVGAGGHCRCDCEDGNRDCVRIKRGKEYFSLKDRLCIQKGECGYPACEFGVYMRNSGRCPRKAEKFEALSKVTPK